MVFTPKFATASSQSHQSKYMGLICAGGVSTEDFQKEFPALMEHVVSTGRAFVIRTLPKARAYWYFFIKHPEEGLAQIKDRKEFLLNAVSDWINPYPEVIKKHPMTIFSLCKHVR